MQKLIGCAVVLCLAYACGGKTFVEGVPKGAGGSANGGASGTTTSSNGGTGNNMSSTAASAASDAVGTPAGSPASSSSGGPCNKNCGIGLSCCNNSCINPLNDIFNCGKCNNVCPGTFPFGKTGG